MRFWSGVIAMVNSWTGDNRRIDSVSWREFPLSLRVQREDNGGHSNAIPCGSISRIWLDGDLVMGEGVFDENDDGAYASGLVESGSLRGVSIDPGFVEAEDVVIADDGTVIPFDEWLEYPPGEEPWPAPFVFGTIYGEYEIGALTLVAVPAFAEARIDLVESLSDAPAVEDVRAVASSTVAGLSPAAMVLAPVRPAVRPTTAATAPVVAIGAARVARLVASAAWRPAVDLFRPQELPAYTPFRIDPDTGEVAGHAYPWNGAHRGFSATYVRPPRSTDFTQFLTGGTVVADDGSEFHVGVIVAEGGHRMTAAEFDRWAEDPANQLGVVVPYADAFGVQMRGVVWPDIDPVRLARSRSAFPSGDWRWDRGEQKLYRMAMVSNPGYHSLEQDGVVERRLVASFAGSKPAGAGAAAGRVGLSAA